jgi:SAM-dependent methyltransferase
MKQATEEIRKYWEEVAKSPLDKDGLRPTARDPFLQAVVEQAIAERLSGEAKLIDIGCGDGLSTMRFARITRKTVGIDYVEAFVQACQVSAAQEGIPDIIFEQASVLDLEGVRKNHGLFDQATSIRCLINLPSWNLQRHAIKEIANSIRPEGMLFISEGWHENFNNLNEYRQKLFLPKIPLVEYNLLIAKADFEEEIDKYFHIIEYVNLGLYVFLSRIVQPCFVFPTAPSHMHPLNETAAKIVNTGVGKNAFQECDYCGVYVLKRKG